MRSGQESGDTEKPVPAKKKLQVFVSSPFGGMEDYRRAVMEGVVRAGHVPILLENFSFRNEADIPVIVDAMKSCQVYILILGHRYGSLVDESACEKVRELCPGIDVKAGISFTELEYRLAKYLEKPHKDGEQKQLAIYTILFNKERVTKKRNKVMQNRGGPDSSEPLSEKEKSKRNIAFWEFYDTVANEKKFGKPLDDENDEITKATLPLKICLALNNLDVSDLQGWIPEPKGIPPELIPAISQNRLTQAIIGSLGMFGSLDVRVGREPELKQRACEFFWKEYGRSIIDMDVNLFFESGSTIAFLADALGTRIDGRHTIASNNVLAHLLLWMVNRKRCEIFPNTTPDPTDQFGATFGTHIDDLYDKRALLTKPPEPDYTGQPLDKQEMQAITKTLKESAAPNHWQGKTLLLGAISGIQMSESPKIIWGKGTKLTDKLKSDVTKCRGFHVGSYKNKLFKRFMYETKLPIMVFLDESKIDCEVKVGRCHFIFDHENFTWEKFIKGYPVAFCVGCRSENIKNCTNAFEEKGFEIVPDNGTYANRAFIARNSVFVKRFDSDPQTN